VMYGGKVVESGLVEELFNNPQHPYTWGLLNSVPRLDAKSRGKLIPIKGTPPDLLNPPVGCGFVARCPHAMKVCLDNPPAYTPLSPSHQAACWLLDSRAPKVTRSLREQQGVVV